MKLLDLFCGGGGCSVGYSRAGFEVEGVDINKNHSKYYPFKFHCDDAIDFLFENFEYYDVIHASPPCQGYSKHVTSADSIHVPTRGKNEPRLIEPLREFFQEFRVPYIIENVVSAREYMQNPIELCGTMFGLPIRRHRLFETSFDIKVPEHPSCIGVAKQYAAEKGWEYRDMSVTGKGRGAGIKDRWAEIMGVDWNMTQAEFAESIPPSYTEYIGKEILKCVNGARG
jgi:DNA (cytosine-5)-methyltransferase 1